MLQDNQLMSGVRVGELIRFFRSLYRGPVDQSTLLGMAVSVTCCGVEPTYCLEVRHNASVSRWRLSGIHSCLCSTNQRRRWTSERGRLSGRGCMPTRAAAPPCCSLRTISKRLTTMLIASWSCDQGASLPTVHLKKSKAAGGAGRVVRFQVLDRATDRFDRLPGVTSVERNGRTVTLHTGDADATVWGLFPLRDAVSHLEVGEGILKPRS